MSRGGGDDGCEEEGGWDWGWRGAAFGGCEEGLCMVRAEGDGERFMYERGLVRGGR